MAALSWRDATDLMTDALEASSRYSRTTRFSLSTLGPNGKRLGRIQSIGRPLAGADRIAVLGVFAAIMAFSLTSCERALPPMPRAEGVRHHD